MIEQQADFPGNVAAFTCTGRVIEADHDTVPAVPRLFRAHERARLHYESSEEFAGFDVGRFQDRYRLFHALGADRRRYHQTGGTLFWFFNVSDHQIVLGRRDRLCPRMIVAESSSARVSQ